VAANTAARHDAVTLAGTPNYLTLAGQVITRALINLTSHVTGILPLANGGTGSALTDPNADRILFWDDSANATAFLTASTGLTLSGTNLTVRTASASQTGIVELATTAETETGTDATRAVTPDGLNDMTTLAGKAWFLDEDNMASDSATKVPSQQSVKAYADTKVGYLTTTTTSSATPTPTGNAQRNELIVTALAENCTIAAPTGTPAAGNMLKVIITASGGTRTVGYNAALTAGNVTRTTSVPSGETLVQVYQYENSQWVAHYDNIN
jgi:hypothetical protein